MFPVDDETLRYLEFTGRPAQNLALVEAYAKEQGLWRDPGQEPVFSEHLELDLSTVVPSLAGPKRPQDRVRLDEAKAATAAPSPTSCRPARPRRGSQAGRPAAGQRRGAEQDRPRQGLRAVVPGERPAGGQPAEDNGSEAPHPAHSEDDRVRLEPRAGGAVRTARPSTSTTATSSSRRSRPARTPRTRRSCSPPGCSPSTPSSAASTSKPWVKTTLAPGSKVVMDYYERSGLLPYLEKLRFNLVGFGCTTCIGNSGPLPRRSPRP
jgi:aconitate hydratase